MQNNDFELAIIGGGCIGSSILYELCRRGFSNLTLIDHGKKTLSATAHSGGMLRVFHEHPHHVDLALQHFFRLEQYQKSKLFTEPTKINGSLYFFNKNQFTGYTCNLKTMVKAHYPFEVLNSSTGKKRFPQFLWDNKWAIYEPHGGHFSTLGFIDDLHKQSIQYGAKIFNDFKVNHIEYSHNRYHIFNENSQIIAKKLVLAGGALFHPMLKKISFNLPLQIKKITSYLVSKAKQDYLLPNFFDRTTLNFGCFGTKKHVLLSQPECTNLLYKPRRKIIKKNVIPDIYSPQRLGFLGKLNNFSQLYIATGWGGTGFKFALEIGHRVVLAIEKDRHIK